MWITRSRPKRGSLSFDDSIVYHPFSRVNLDVHTRVRSIAIDAQELERPPGALNELIVIIGVNTPEPTALSMTLDH